MNNTAIKNQIYQMICCFIIYLCTQSVPEINVGFNEPQSVKCLKNDVL